MVSKFEENSFVPALSRGRNPSPSFRAHIGLKHQGFPLGDFVFLKMAPAIMQSHFWVRAKTPHPGLRCCCLSLFSMSSKSGHKCPSSPLDLVKAAENTHMYKLETQHSTWSDSIFYFNLWTIPDICIPHIPPSLHTKKKGFTNQAFFFLRSKIVVILCDWLIMCHQVTVHS